MFVLEFPQCVIVCSLHNPICSPTDLDSKEEKWKNKKEGACVLFSNICSQHKIHYGKHSYFNRLRAEAWVKFIISMRLKGTCIFLPTLKRLENVLKSYMCCICFVCGGKCFCVAPVFLDVPYSWPCRWVLCLQCWSKGVCKVLFKSSLRVGVTCVSWVWRIYWKYIQQMVFISMRIFNLVSWVLGFFPLSTTKIEISNGIWVENWEFPFYGLIPYNWVCNFAHDKVTGHMQVNILDLYAPVH